MIKEKRNKIIWFLSLLFISPLALFSQDKSIIVDTIMHKEIKMQLPSDYKRDLFCYGEGCFLTYYYQDTTNISIFLGRQQRLPLLHEDNGYYSCSIDTINDRIISLGKKNGKYWREDVYKEGLRIYYDGVKKDRKSFFDSILNNFIFKNIEMKDE